MPSKTKLKLQNNTKAKLPSSVRIVIDEKLATVISEVLLDYPLLSTTEAVKVVLSRGVTKSGAGNFSQFFSDLKQTNPVKMNLTEDEMFLEYNKFSQK